MFSECFLSCHNHWKKCFVNSLFKKNMYLCVSMCQCAHVCGYPGRIGEGAGSPGSGVISSCGFAQNRYWKLNSGLLQQCVLFIAEPSSRPYLYVFEHLVNTQELIPCLRTKREDSAVCECTVVWAHASVIEGLYYDGCKQRYPPAVVPFSSNLLGPRVAQNPLECSSVPVSVSVISPPLSDPPYLFLVSSCTMKNIP